MVAAAAISLAGLSAPAGALGGGGSPFGSLDRVTSTASGLEVRGWVIDPDTTAAVTAAISLDGVVVSEVLANADRPDVGAAYPAYGPGHGVLTLVTATPGSHRVCVTARNVGGGSDTAIGCRDILVGGSPFGNAFDRARAVSGGIELKGWAIDPDTASPAVVSIRVDGVAQEVSAGGARPDVQKVYPAYGANHGFALTVPAEAGAHEVCITFRNSGLGQDVERGCRTVLVGGSPLGLVERVNGSEAGVEVSGWAIDPDVTDAATVVIGVDGSDTEVLAQRVRADLPAAYGPYGPSHGFELTLPANPGSHEVCVLVRNGGVGSETTLGCRDVLVGGPAVGSLELVAGMDGAVAASGWAIDPDTTAPVDVDITVAGTATSVSAGVPRDGLPAQWAPYGRDHGFDAQLTADPGPREVCATIEATGLGAPVSLGCQTVVVGGSPIGHLDQATGSDLAVRVTGWAIDPDTTEPIAVRVVVDGVPVSTTADKSRADVRAAYDWYGAEHGFDVTTTAAPGSHRVCVVALNVGLGSDTPLGCVDVVVTSPVPGPGTVGVPAGTSLRVYEGDLVITTPGTVIDGWDIRGYVSVKADNVTIRRSVLRGGPAATRNRALLMAWWGYRNLVVEDSTLVAANPSLHIDGLSGSNFTARRLDIHGVVDPVKVIGSNVTLVDSWLHDTLHSDNDPNQSDGRTHDDNVQITGGSNIVIRGNVMEDAHNAAIMISQGYAPTTQVRIESNWLGGGACTVNATNSPITTPITGMSITGNRFRPGSHDTRCPMRLPSSAQISVTSNTWDATGATTTPNWF